MSVKKVAAVETRGLTKYYGESRGIVALDLRVEQGDIFGFIGPNGAGKSTTIRALLGLISPTSGNGRVFGMDIEKEKERVLERVGYMPSEAMFYNGMRVSEIIKFSASLHKKDCSDEAKRLCERLMLDTSKKVEQLSLGNRKKVSIVCAFQHKPDLYVLDEPTSGLDPLMQKEFYSILRERNKEGATIFLSSHVLSEIQRNCTQAAIIREGKIVAAGSVEELSRTNAKRVNVHGINHAPVIKGVRDVKEYGNNISFLYNGGIRELLQELSKQPVEDMTITEPDLEEIFMHYYTDGGEAR